VSDFEKLIFERKDAITTITLNRPQCHNALDRELSDELNDAVRRVREDRDCRIMILRGAGDTFCAGDDLKDFMTWKVDDPIRGHDPYWQVRKYQETVQIIEDLDAVTIAVVDGACTGGGLELTLVCDFVIATRRSRWGMPEIDWGITPGWGGTSRLARAVGWRKAKEWNLIGQLFSGEVAERYGLVNRVCEPEELSGEVDALVEVMLDKNRSAVRRTKFIMNKGIDQHISASLAFEVPILPYPLGDTTGAAHVRHFQTRGGREQRRRLSRDFWQD
jgi:enoyl-CoA hydratase/carnithine racemase